MAKTYGLFNLKLKDGMTASDFEAAIARLAPKVTVLPSFRSHLLKVDRGSRVGQYMMVWEFDSEETRNRYFPAPGEMSAEFQQWQQANAAMLEQFDRFVEWEHSADIVEIASTPR